VYSWEIRGPRRVHVRVIDTDQSPVPGCQVEALFAVGGIDVRTEASAQYDPSLCNAWTANHASELASATTDGSGCLSMMLASTRGVGLRISKDGFVARVANLGTVADEEVSIQLHRCGTVEGQIGGAVGEKAFVLLMPSGGADGPTTLQQVRGAFRRDGVPVGTYAVYLSQVNGKQRIDERLATIEVRPGEVTRVDAVTQDPPRWIVELCGADLEVGDRLEARADGLPWMAAEAVVQTGGQTKLALPSGRYEVTKHGQNGREVRVASEEVVVSGPCRVDLQFRKEPARVRLMVRDAPYAMQWVRISGSVNEVFRTDEGGWVMFDAVPRLRFDLQAVKRRGRTWLIAPPAWRITDAVLGGDVAARE